MIIYRDENGTPTFLCAVIASEWPAIRHWCRTNNYTLGPNVMVGEMAEFVRMVGMQIPRRVQPPYPWAWSVHEIRNGEGVENYLPPIPYH